MKLCVYSIPEITPGKRNIKDSRLDQVHNITKSKKETYMQVELVAENSALDADAILVLKDSRTDLVLKDLEFVETRLGRSDDESEKALLTKLKNILEKEEFIFKAGFSRDEIQAFSKYGLLTIKPITVAEKQELDDPDVLLARAVRESGFISFFTTGEKETRAWLIKKGSTAWEASGSIHSDIQKGFIRAEIISLDDFIASGGESQAKQAGKLRLEQKDYVMQDADLTNFRFNK